MDKNIFSISAKNSNKEIPFVGILHDGVYGFISIEKDSLIRCKVRLNLSYDFPEQNGETYIVQYIVNNPRYKGQKEALLKSNKVEFTY